MSGLLKAGNKHEGLKEGKRRKTKLPIVLVSLVSGLFEDRRNWTTGTKI